MRHPDPWAAELADWARDLRAARRSPGTVKLRLYHLRCFADAAPTPYAVTHDHLAEYLDQPSWAPEYLKSVRSSLRAFYQWATHLERIDRDPSRMLLPVTVQRGMPRPTAPTALQAALGRADDRVRRMLVLGSRVGLRAGEVATVRRSDVVELLVGEALRVTGKGGKTRIVPIAPEVAHMIRTEGDTTIDWLFPGRVDGHLASGTVTRLVSEALRGGGHHPLRHRYATNVLKGSNNLRAVQMLLGHASIATTQIYTAVDDDELARAALTA